MFQLRNSNRVIEFMSLSKFTFVFSLILIAGSLFSISTKWFNWGLDFTGGTLVEIGFEQNADLSVIRKILNENNFEDASVQSFGSAKDVLIRFRPREGISSEMIGDTILSTLEQNIDVKLEMRRIEFVGPNVGKELAEAGALAIVIALVCILIYVSLRFEWRLAAGSVLALTHDVILTLGIFSFLEIEIDLTIIAALLTVVGYSLNDTIVVFDRIRENFLKMRKGTSSEVINGAISQTLSRTLVTSLTTLLVVIALLVQGGALIQGFAIALLLGIVVGTYSSIYVASSLALKLGISRETLIPPVVEKEGEEIEHMS